MSKGIFITGTGTGVGKTFVSALVTKKLYENGFNVGYYKAALSGAEEMDGTLIAGDAKYVSDRSGLEHSIDTKVSYVFKTPVSPHLAAEREGNPIELSKIKKDFEAFSVRYDYLCVEGSGGIICPLNMEEGNIIFQEDVIRALDLNILIVASAELGTINATLLTVAYIQAKGMNIKGILLNNYDHHNYLHVDNQKQIERISGIPVIACVEEGEDDLEISIDGLQAVFQEGQ